jgi:two-component system, cell cycle sensor histidine kinase and response regulator CckA
MSQTPRSDRPAVIPTHLQVGSSVPVDRRRRFIVEFRRAAWDTHDTVAFEDLLVRLRDGLEWLDIPFWSCGLNLVDTGTDPPTIWVYALDRPGQWSRMRGTGYDTVFRFWRGQKVVYRSNLERDDPYDDLVWVRELGYKLRSIIDIPFSHGTLAINSERPDAFTSANLALLAEVAEVLSDSFCQLGQADRLSEVSERLSQAQLQLEHKTLVLDTYRRLGRDILASLSLAEIIGRLVEDLVKAAVFRCVGIALVESGRVEIRALGHMAAGGRLGLLKSGAEMTCGEDAALARVASGGEAEVTGEDEWRRCVGPVPFAGGTSHFVPVKRDAEVLAVLVIYHPKGQGDEIRQRIDLMQPLLEQLAIAIDHSRLYEERRRRNEELERRVDERTRQLQALNRDLEREIVQRRRTEDTLRASEESFRQLAENIREVFWLTDALEDRLLYVSPAFETVWGVPCQELYQDTGKWLEAIHPEDRSIAWESSDQQRQGMETDVSYRLRLPDGSWRYIRDRGFPIRDKQGQVYRIGGLAEDVTAQREMEEALSQGQKMQAIGQLTAGISHNFNNLLTVISIGLEMASEDEPLGERALGNAKAATQKAVEMVNQLMDMARVEGQADGRALDLGEIVREAVELARKTFDRRIVLTADIAPNLPLIKGDAGRLEQVCLNLMLNARDAVKDSGAPRIEIDVSARVPFAGRPADGVVLCIRDSGVGMDEETLKRLFEPFFTTKPIGSGTGLGLATAYGTVKEHGGLIECESKLGEGAVFSVFLPSTCEKEEEVGSTQPKVAIPVEGETVLVVDDEPLVREGLSEVLSRQGYKTLSAANGTLAWDMLVERDFAVDLVVLDLSMPEMSGEEFLTRVQQVATELKVVVSSGYAASTLDFGQVQGFLPKPYSMDEACDAVRQALET